MGLPRGTGSLVNEYKDGVVCKRIWWDRLRGKCQDDCLSDQLHEYNFETCLNQDCSFLFRSSISVVPKSNLPSDEVFRDVCLTEISFVRDVRVINCCFTVVWELCHGTLEKMFELSEG